MDPIRFQLTEVQPGELSPNILSLVAGKSGRLLHFKNAILARAEVNGNRDQVNPDGIAELAQTLPLTAMDKDHLKQVVIGYYTDARVLKDGKDDVLSCDGIVFADRYPMEAAGIQDGTYQQSIEADAKSVECSVCGNVFSAAMDYCKHIKEKTGVRILHGLTAKGGAITRIPAGTNTKFDMSKISLIASLEQDVVPDGVKRAANRLMATIDILRANPGSTVPLASPILAPVLWNPSDEWIEATVRKIMSRSLQAQASQNELVLAKENELEASNKNLLSAVDQLRLELNARIDQLVAENAELKASLEKAKMEKPSETVGVIGFGWGNSMEGARETGKTKLKWGTE